MKHSDAVKAMLIASINDIAVAPEKYALNPGMAFLRNRKLVHHFIDTPTLSARYLRHCRVGFNRRCRRIASFIRLALTQISGT